MTIEDYQIVNGCQTSHVLFNNRELLKSTTFVPIKIIATEDNDVTNAVIKATNRQTYVGNENLAALSDFQKKLESYYRTFDYPKNLYYERRSRQYNGLQGIEKVRIVSIRLQIRCFASMFLDDAHRAGRYMGTLLKLIGNKLFLESHDPIAYYTSAFANYRMESFFRNNSIEPHLRKYKNHLLMVLRYQVGGGDLPGLGANKIKGYCQGILEVLWDQNSSLDAFENAAGAILPVVNRFGSGRDIVKTQTFTEAVREAATS